MYSFKISNFSSGDFDKIYVNSFISPIPSKTQERVKILGKNGTLLIGEAYNDRRIEINILLINDDIRTSLRALIVDLKPDNDVLISFSYEPDIFYYGRFEALENYSFESPTAFKTDLIFNAIPEFFKIIDDEIDLDDIKSITDITNLSENTQYIKRVY